MAVGSDSSRLHPSWVALKGARCLVSRWKHRLCRGKWKAVCSFRGILRLWEAEEINRLQAVHFPDGDAEAQRVKMQTSDAPKSSPKPFESKGAWSDSRASLLLFVPVQTFLGPG